MYPSISELLDRHPAQSKVLFTPQYQFGLTIEDTLARKQGGWAALSCATPRQYAGRITQYHLDGQPPPAGAGALLAAWAVDTLSDAERRVLLLPGQAGAQAGTARSLARLFDALRCENVLPDKYQALGDELAGPEGRRHRAQTAAFRAYEKLLAEHEYVDTAQSLQKAIQFIKSGLWSVSGEVFGVLAELTLTRLELQLLKAIKARAEAFYLIASRPPLGKSETSLSGSEAAGEFPKGTAAHLLSDVPKLDESVPGSTGDMYCHAAVGASAEVRAVFRDIVQRDIPFGEVEIAYTSSDPYLSLIDGLAEKWDLPVTPSVGRPVAETRPGQSILGWLEWMQEGLDAPHLISLLRGGLLRVDRVQDPLFEDMLPAHSEHSEGQHVVEESAPAEGLAGPPLSSFDSDNRSDETPLPASRAATLLASIRYNRGSDGRLMYLPAIDRQINRLGERLQSAQANGESGHTVDRIEKERKDWAQLRFVVRELLALTPSGVLSASEMAGRCRSFLIRWGQTDAPPQDKADRTIDESARNRLVDQFSALDNAQIAYRAPTARLNGYMTNMVRSDKVRATRPLPGKIHVAPLESAAYANRSHLYVMGLDATSTGQFMHEAHLTLSDDERERISSATGAALVQLGGAPGLKAWKVEQVRTRHTGDLSLMMRTFDLREGEERHPSPIYLRWGGKEAEAAQKRPIELANRSHGYLPLDETGDWLRAQTAALQGDLPGEGKARREEGVRHAQGPQNAQDNESPVGTVPVSNGQAPGPSFAALYPGAAQGLEAERQRVSDTYTAFDGLLTGEGYPDLDVFDGERVVSASRLERLANTPYLYFLRHVLRVRPLDEPALEETGWLDPLQRGSILHDAFETFVRQLGGRAPEAGDEPALRHALKDRYEDEIDRIPPSGTFIENKTWQELWADARIFLRAETESDHDGTPYKLEYGFGLPPDRRSQDGKERPARLTFDNGTAITLRGQIDRIDEHPDGTFSIWDYKTGRSMSYNESDLLQDGKVLQWALYSYAFEALEQVDVREAGYFFASAQELGRRISSGGRPARYRQEVSEALDRLAELARTGTFPPNLNHYSWRYSGFERCIPGMKKRTKAMRRKEWPEGRPTPIHLL